MKKNLFIKRPGDLVTLTYAPWMSDKRMDYRHLRMFKISEMTDAIDNVAVGNLSLAETAIIISCSMKDEDVLVMTSKGILGWTLYSFITKVDITK